MLQDKYGRLLIVGAFIVISVILIMAPGMHSNKADEEQLNFTSMPKDNISKSHDMDETSALPNSSETQSTDNSFSSPEAQMLDAWGMNKPAKTVSEEIPDSTSYSESANNQMSNLNETPVNVAPEQEVATEAVKAPETPAAPKKSKYKQIHVNGKCFAPPTKALPMLATECKAATYTLGVRSCPTADEKDGWAGAVRTCGGIDNMPDLDDLLAIAKILYSTESIEIPEKERGKYKAYGKYNPDNVDCDSYERAGISYQESKAQAYGYPLQPGFSVWGKTEISQKYGLNLLFEKDLVNYSSCSSRFVDNYFAVCKVECE